MITKDRHPYFDDACIQRLKDEYDKYGNLIIGFDFDNTIFDYHARGGDYSNIIKLLQTCKELNLTLCLYTVETREEWLDWKIMYCDHYSIHPDYINSSPLLPGTEKPFFNILLDDRAGLESAYNILAEVLTYIKYESPKFNMSRKE